MKTIIKMFIPLYLLSLIACDNMNSLHKEYLEWGEAIYTGVVDSLKAAPGYERVKFSWEINADPRITKTVIYWNDRGDSMVVAVERTQPGRIQMEYILQLAAGGYLFELATKDDDGHQSRYIEASVNIYGSTYANSTALRSSRPVKALELIDDETVEIYLGAVEVNTYRYSELTYLSYENGVEGEEKKIIVENETEMITLEKIRIGDPIIIQSYYYPSEDALDGLPAKKFECEILKEDPPESGNE